MKPVAVAFIVLLHPAQRSPALDPLKAADILEAQRFPGQPKELQPLMCKRGDLLFEDAFSESWEKNWKRYKGDWKIDQGRLRGAEVPADSHNALLLHKIELQDAILQVSFRLEGQGQLGVGFGSASEHVCRVVLNSKSQLFRIQKMSGKGDTTKSAPVGEKKMKFESERWYTLLWEVRGNEMVAQLDDGSVLFGEKEGVDRAKAKIQLAVSGQGVWIDDLRVWKASPVPAWEERKKTLPASER